MVPALLRLLTLIAIANALVSSAFADSRAIREVCESSGRFGASQIVKDTIELMPLFEKADWSNLPSAIAERCRNQSGKPESLFCETQLGVLIWALHMLPDASAGRAAYEIQTSLIGEGYHRYFATGSPAKPAADFDFDRELERDGAAPIRAYTREEIAYTKKVLNEVAEGDWATKNLAELKAKAPLICSIYGGALSAVTCTKALRRLGAIMHPKAYDGFVYSMFDLYEEFLTDVRYAQALPRLALKIRERLRRAEAGDIATDGFYLTDTIASFAETGASHAESVEYAWKWMAIYSTRGASFQKFYQLLHERQLGLGLALLAASSGASALDQYRHRDPRSMMKSYTLPNAFPTSCYYGKPYHFWMSAYFTRRLEREGYGARGGALAAYATGALYEFGSDTRGRDPRRGVIDAVDSPYGRWIKTNLFFNAMGVRYGREMVKAENQRALRLETDPLFERFLEDSLPTEMLPSRIEASMVENEKGRYLLFSAKYQPFPLLFAFLRL
jgi:hypothetical protein